MVGYLREHLLQWLPSSRLEIYPVWEVSVARPHLMGWDTQHLQAKGLIVSTLC